MTDREMIEEMASIICKETSNKGLCEKCGFKRQERFGYVYQCHNFDNAEALYEQNYRKIPEGAVVLTKEEYERFQRIENTIKRISTVSPTEAESENKALKGTIAIVLAQKRNIWKSYNKKCKELGLVKKKTRKETAREIYNRAVSHPSFFEFLDWIKTKFGLEIKE